MDEILNLKLSQFLRVFLPTFVLLKGKNDLSLPSDANFISAFATTFRPGRVAQSVGHLTRKSGVLGSIPSLAAYFRFSSAFSRRAVFSYWRKYVHEVLVNRLAGLSLRRKSVVRLTDRPDMTLDVYRGRKTTMQQQSYHISYSIFVEPACCEQDMIAITTSVLCMCVVRPFDLSGP